MRKDFAVIILSRARADNVKTINTLRRHGYTGEIYIAIDDDDPQIEEYKRIYGDMVIVQDKKKAREITDLASNNTSSVVVFARNYVYEVAEKIGKRYILVLDDDYTYFFNRFDENRNYITSKVKIINMDAYIKAYLDFFISANLDCLAFAQTGELLGGENASVSKIFKEKKLMRKAMNAFFFDIKKPLYFHGRTNEDVNMYLLEGKIGKKIFTYPRVILQQERTQTQTGGLTEVYLDEGTYVKSFYSVIFAPSCVEVRAMNSTYKRLHHHISWRYAVPKILDERWKK